MDNSQVVKLNIGGTIFQCYRSIFETYPQSKLARLEGSNTTEHFFDRDPSLFGCILDSYRKGAIHVSKHICGETFLLELEFWELSPRHVAPCCWKTLYGNEEDKDTMDQLIKQSDDLESEHDQPLGLRKKIWLFLDQPNSSKLAFTWGLFASLVVLTSLVAMSMMSLPTFQESYTETEVKVVYRMVELLGLNKNTDIAILSTKPLPVLIHIDIVCLMFLTVEFVVLLAVCPRIKVFLSSVIPILSLIGYVARWTVFIMSFYIYQMDSIFIMRLFVVLKYLSVLKIFRLFLVTKHIPSIRVIGLTFSSSRKELAIFVFVLTILVCLFGLAMYLCELTFNERITNLPNAMYWALITLTTVGYGDYTPVTTAGHVLAAMCAACGVLVLTMPIGIIASTFYSFYTCNKYASIHTLRYKYPACPKVP